MERRPDVEMDWKCRRKVTASIPLPPPAGLGLVAFVVAPPELETALVLTAITEPARLPTTRRVVMVAVMEEAEELSASISVRDSS